MTQWYRLASKQQSYVWYTNTSEDNVKPAVVNKQVNKNKARK